MAFQKWTDLLVASTVVGPTLASSASATTLLPTNALKTFPADFWEIGRALEIDVLGSLGTLVTTPGTMTFALKLGSVVAFTTGAIQLNATAHTTKPFWLKVFLTCRAVGSGTSANLMGQAIAFGAMFTATAGQADGANSQTILMAPATAPAVGTGFDSTAAQQLDLHGTFSIADAANTCAVHQYLVKLLN